MKNPIKRRIRAILLISFFALAIFGLVYPVSAATTIIKAEPSKAQPEIGDTLTVTIKVSNAQNLYGLDLTLVWNPDVLSLVSATHQLGVESHPGGVLHESTSYPIEVITNSASQATAEYHLSATSTGATTPAFSGSGTIATVTFTVKTTGATGLAFNEVETSQLNSEGTADLVIPSTTVDPVTAIPEFPLVLLIGFLITTVTAALVVSTRMPRNRRNPAAY